MLRRAFVTGGAGYVGSTITTLLLSKGYEVAIYDDLSSGSLSRLPITDNRLSVYTGSVTDLHALTAAIAQSSPDAVFHMAALHYIPECVQRPESTIDINIKGTLNVISAASKQLAKPRVILASSASVYGATTPAPQFTNATPQPCDIYGYSKMIGEHIVSSNYDDYVIARLFNVFGDSDPVPHLIPSIIRQLDRGVVYLGNPDSRRDFVHVRDAARAFISLAEYGKAGKVYNIGSGINHSVRQVTSLIQAQTGRNVQFVFQSDKLRATDPPTLCADIGDITRDTGWKPAINFDQGLATAIEASGITVGQP